MTRSWTGRNQRGAGRAVMAGLGGILSRTSSFLPADVSDSLPFATVGSGVTPRGSPADWPFSRAASSASLKQA